VTGESRGLKDDGRGGGGLGGSSVAYELGQNGSDSSGERDRAAETKREEKTGKKRPAPAEEEGGKTRKNIPGVKRYGSGEPFARGALEG